MASFDPTRSAHPEHPGLFDSLPCYVNGSLAPDVHRRVQVHLGECLVCRRELRRLELLASALAVPAMEQAGAAAYTRLGARLARAERPGERWRGLLSRARGAGRWLVSLGVAAALVLAALLAQRQDAVNLPRAAVDQRFQTLGRRADPVSALGAPLVRVVLDDALGPTARAAWLAGHGAELVDGPSDIGVFTIKVDIARRTMADAVAGLRADPATLFVEPVDVVGARPDRRR